MDISLFDDRVKKQPLNRGQLRWACRRGMLELDILLGDFLDAGYDELTEKEQQLFQDLLAYPDQELYEIFLRAKKPWDLTLEPLVEKIRRAASRRP